MRDPSDGTEAGATGEYKVVEPPRNLVFTWVWDDQPDQPQLIAGSGATDLTAACLG
jgi:uncharacterized protein YndB with AHSA1/START domain